MGDWEKSFIKIVTGDFVVRSCHFLFLRSKVPCSVHKRGVMYKCLAVILWQNGI
jgi:hypothetical protein